MGTPPKFDVAAAYEWHALYDNNDWSDDNVVRANPGDILKVPANSVTPFMESFKDSMSTPRVLREALLWRGGYLPSRFQTWPNSSMPHKHSKECIAKRTSSLSICS